MPTPSYPLTTARLTLRPYRDTDLVAIHELFGRADVSRYLNWEPMNKEQAGALLKRRLTQTQVESDGDGILLAAEDIETGRMIGEFMLSLTSAKSRQGEIGWVIHPDVQGRGLATEGAREMLRVGFEELDLHRIVAECDPRNTASLKVMERLGMRREAHFIDHEFLKGEWIGSIVSAMLDTEWHRTSGAKP